MAKIISYANEEVDKKDSRDNDKSDKYNDNKIGRYGVEKDGSIEGKKDDINGHHTSEDEDKDVNIKKVKEKSDCKIDDHRWAGLHLAPALSHPSSHPNYFDSCSASPESSLLT